MKPKQITWGKDQEHIALPITREALTGLGITDGDIDKGQSSGDLKVLGPWQLPLSYRALAMSCVWTPKEVKRYTAERESITVHGMRTLTDCRESGHQLVGRVKVGGKRYRGFTSSQLFNCEGKLVDVATIHVCR